MKSLRSGLAATLFSLSSLIPLSSQSLDSPSHDACGKVVQEIAAQTTENPWISAKTAYECLIDVPFHEPEAVHTLEQIRLFLNFYSAQAYFANPPTPELELNPVDLNKTLADIETNIKEGKYPDEYSFNRDLFNLFGDYRDGKVSWYPTCHVAFIFTHTYPLMSVAETPDSEPEIHLVEITETGFEVGDKVVKINGLDAHEYLVEMANNHPELEWVDPDARYNQLFIHASGGEWVPGAFTSRRTYDDQDLTLTWENGTEVTVEWLAELDYSIDPTSFHSTDTFYSKVCVRSRKEIEAVYARYTDMSVSWVGEPEPTKGNNDHHQGHGMKARSGIPLKKRSTEPHIAPVMFMQNGEMNLFVLDDETGVLEITSFDWYSEEFAVEFLATFSMFLSDAILYLKNLGITKIIIDLSGNKGGVTALGNDAAMQFFPEADHFFGSNMRWNPAIDTMLTKGKDPTDMGYWDIGHYKKIDGSDFASYKEFLGPVFQDGDYFTPIAIADIAEENTEDSLGGLPPSYTGHAPFDAENIILLSSGMCGGPCALFAEALLDQDVHSVTFGGRPKGGPMQTVGGMKGSQSLSFDHIVGWAHYFLGDDVSKYDSIPDVPTVNTLAAGINLRNSWRRGNQDTPLEFIYDPSEYRLYYTADMYVYPEAMWEAARNVVWGDANDISSSNDTTPDSVGSASGSGDDGEGITIQSSKDNKKKPWKSIGELIWRKIDGHEMDFDY